jgi:hypothetical protein
VHERIFDWDTNVSLGLTQIVDLRSSVSRDSCIAVVLCAMALKRSYEGLFCFLLEGLLKQVHISHIANIPSFHDLIEKLFPQVVKSVAVMAFSAHVCIKLCLQHTTGPLCMTPLVQCVSSKSDLLRERTAEYFLAMITTWPESVLRKVTNVVGGFFFLFLPFVTSNWNGFGGLDAGSYSRTH